MRAGFEYIKYKHNKNIILKYKTKYQTTQYN